MNLILSNVSVGSWILLGVLLLILIVSPFLMRAKNKKEMENQQKMMDAINKGDTVLTSAGVIGKVVGIDTNKQGYKTLTLETGDEKHKGYMCVDIRSIYYNLSNPVMENATVKNEENTKVENQKDTVIEMPENISKSLNDSTDQKVETTTEDLENPANNEVKETSSKHKKNKNKN